MLMNINDVVSYRKGGRLIRDKAPDNTNPDATN